MKKRVLSILMCLTLAVTSLVGCGGGAEEGTTTENTETTTETTETTTETTEEDVTINEAAIETAYVR